MSTTGPSPTPASNSAVLCEAWAASSALLGEGMGELLSDAVFQATTSRRLAVGKLEGRAGENLASGKSARVRAAFPRQPWISLQRLVVMADPSKCPQLKRDRAKSKLMI
eukprot:6677769-Pyramimonas_sp.AAC.1